MTQTTERRTVELRRVLAGHRHGLVFVYGDPDPDGLASAWALQKLMAALGVTARIRYTGELGRIENEAMVRLLGIPAQRITDEELATAELIAVVDAQPEFFRGAPLPRCDVVIDHHPRKREQQPGAVALTDVRPSALATSSILTEYLVEAGERIDAKLATALYYGIQTDSRNLQRNPSLLDTKALLQLERKVNRALLRRIEFSCYSLVRLDYFAVALVRLRYSGNVLYSHVGPVPTADVCVQIADFLIRVREAKWALVSGVAGDRLVVVFRCDGHRKNAGATAEAAFGAIGSAGGHRTAGRAEIQATALPSGMMLTQNENIEHFILESMARADAGFKPLLRGLPSAARPVSLSSLCPVQ